MKFKLNNITILYLITFFAALYFYHPIITLYFQQRGLNFVQINSLWAIIIGAQSLSEVPTGIIADKIGRKYSIIIALALQLAGEVIYVFANNYLLFALVSVIAGLGFAFSSGCFEAMIYDSLKEEGREEEMQKVAGLNHSFGQLAIIIGSFGCSFIAADLEMDSFIFLIIITACSVATALLVSFFLKEPSTEYKRSAQSSFVLLKDGVQILKTNKSLQKISILYLLATPFVNYLLNFYPPYFVQAKVPGLWFGIALSVASLGGVLTSKYAYLLEKNLGVNKGVLAATFTPGILYILMAAIFHPLISLILFVLSYSSMSLQKPLFADYTNRHIESRNRATVLSIISMFSGIYVALMGFIIGAIADYTLSYSFLFMGAIIIASTILFRIDESHVKTNVIKSG